MLELSVYCIRKTPHLSMPVTGLMMLEEQKKLRLSFEIDGENRRKYPYDTLLGVYGGGKRVLFDLADGYGTLEKRSQEQVARMGDAVFRRSFSPAETAKLPPELRDRIRPMGFHFHVSYPGNPIDRTASWAEYKNAAFQWMFNGAPRGYFTLEKFECPPKRSERPTVLFYTRLWPEPRESERYESVEALNRSRIRLVTELKKRYGSRFIGGIQFEPKEVGRCGGLMVRVGETKRVRYLKTMRGRADICVGSTGLHNSIGWKTAEYIAASKAVVNERFCFEVPGGFQEEVNYLPFTSVEGCLEQVERLMRDPDRIYEMGRANQAYYQAYGRPDRLMANALGQVFPGFEDKAGEP